MASIKFKPHPYQEKAINWIIDKPRCGLFLDMGLGKTVSTLTAISDLMLLGLVSKVLVIAPLRVADTVWEEETKKWDHLSHIRCSKILGSCDARLKAIDTVADIYIINRENLPWLVDNADFDYDMVVIDELSSFKSPQAKRFKSLRRVIGTSKRVVGLTGTPTPNGLIDLWSQLYLLDRGERLGKTVTGYRRKFFFPAAGSGHIVYTYGLKKGADTQIQDAIKDICFSMSKADYLNMPKLITNTAVAKLDVKTMSVYKRFKKDCVLSLAAEDITAVNAAVLIGKLQQYANGACYRDDKTVEIIHNSKIDVLKELVEEANGSPVLCFYTYKQDRDRILDAIPVAKELKDSDDMLAWNAGAIPLLLAHPASAGHGLNLQDGGHTIVWFSLPWSLELYQQAVARIYRQGQEHPVSVHHIIAEGTVDEDIMSALGSKNKVQEAVLDALKIKADSFDVDFKTPRILSGDKKG